MTKATVQEKESWNKDWRKLPNFRLDAIDREKIIKLLLVDGLSTAVVAKRFGVSAKTIRCVREDYRTATAKQRREEDSSIDRAPR